MCFCLEELFAVICNNDLPHVKREEDLFGFTQENTVIERQYVQSDIELLSNYFSRNFNIAAFGKPAQEIFELSPNIFNLIFHAWMSELPVEIEIIALGRMALASAQACNKYKRRAAENAAADRGDENVCAVLSAAAKTQFEVHRMMGLLRFSPDSNGTYIAFCEPDHLILPAMGEHFSLRFGETPWVIVDIKRKLCLSRRSGEKMKLAAVKTAEDISASVGVLGDDEWEELWRHYHRTINNESRKNLHLQRQLMPKRYWKYLPEM